MAAGGPTRKGSRNRNKMAWQVPAMAVIHPSIACHPSMIPSITRAEGDFGGQYAGIQFPTNVP